MNPQHEQELGNQILPQENQHEDLVWSTEATLMMSCYRTLMKKTDAAKTTFAEIRCSSIQQNSAVED